MLFPLRRTVRWAATTAVVATSLITGQATAHAADDPRIEQYRQALAALKQLAHQPVCDQTPEPSRWVDAGTPDQGSRNVLISAHRGAITLAPENTLKSYEYAFAYGVEFVEVDVQQTRDGRFVALHDSTVDRTTDGTGNIKDLTYDEVRALNAADYEPWKGGEYDGAQVASLDEILALAQRTGGGIELDIKGSVTEEGKLAELVGKYGLIGKSIFNSADSRILAAEPEARLIYNRDDWEPGFLMYEIGQVFKVFGSRLDEYSPESIAAAHDGCAVVMPHAYDAGPDQEVAQFQLARSIGADGVQTNQPALIVAAAGEAVDSRIVVRHKAAETDQVCLVNTKNRLGFPQKALHVEKHKKSLDLTTTRDGCAAVPAMNWRGATVTFAGDGAVHPAAARLAH